MAVFEDPCVEPGFELPTEAGGDLGFGQEGCMIDAVEADRPALAGQRIHHVDVLETLAIQIAHQFVLAHVGAERDL